MVALGLLVFAAAVIVAVVGGLANLGSAHALTSDFSLFGYHLHGSTGQLLLIGVVVGAVGMLGLNMLLAGLGRGFTRRVSSRRELKNSRRQADSLHAERDTLARQLEQERIARARMEPGPAATTANPGHPAANPAYPAYPAEPGAAPPAQPGVARPRRDY